MLSKAVNTWKGIAVYSPIINGRPERSFEDAYMPVRSDSRESSLYQIQKFYF